MPGNPFKAPYRPPRKSPKASTPSKPRVARAKGSTQMPGVTGARAQASAAIRAPKVRVTSAQTKPTRQGKVRQGAVLQQPGKTGSPR